MNLSRLIKIIVSAIAVAVLLNLIINIQTRDVQLLKLLPTEPPTYLNLLSKLATRINNLTNENIDLNKKLDSNFSNLQDSLDKNYSVLNKQILDSPKIQQQEKSEKEQKLQQINIKVVNKTVGALGSGVTLKYNNKYYVLSAGHLADKVTDELELWENDMKICDLKIIKHIFKTPTKSIEYPGEKGSKIIINTTDWGAVEDLLLLAPKDEITDPIFYTELNDTELVTGSEVYIVGNPTGLDDVISMGRIIKYLGNMMYITDNIYFGNSGGGVYTLDGKLVGIVSHLIPLAYSNDVPPYMIYGIVRLAEIKAFLQEIN